MLRKELEALEPHSDEYSFVGVFVDFPRSLGEKLAIMRGKIQVTLADDRPIPAGKARTWYRVWEEFVEQWTTEPLTHVYLVWRVDDYHDPNPPTDMTGVFTTLTAAKNSVSIMVPGTAINEVELDSGSWGERVAKIGYGEVGQPVWEDV